MGAVPTGLPSTSTEAPGGSEARSTSTNELLGRAGGGAGLSDGAEDVRESGAVPGRSELGGDGRGLPGCSATAGARGERASASGLRLSTGSARLGPRAWVG